MKPPWYVNMVDDLKRGKFSYVRQRSDQQTWSNKKIMVELQSWIQAGLRGVSSFLNLPDQLSYT
jgi:hypothetical protein